MPFESPLAPYIGWMGIFGIIQGLIFILPLFRWIEKDDSRTQALTNSKPNNTHANRSKGRELLHSR